MSNTTIYTRRSNQPVDPYATPYGVKRMNYNPSLTTSSVTPSSQTIYALSVPTVSGETYTGVTLQVIQAGTSTAPTGFFVGLATGATIAATGTMLVQSANLASSTSLTTTGQQQFPFSTTWTETQSGLLRCIVVLQNGTFAGNSDNFARISPAGQAGVFQFGLCGTSQTALPANGSNLPAVYTSVGLGFWAGLY